MFHFLLMRKVTSQDQEDGRVNNIHRTSRLWGPSGNTSQTSVSAKGLEPKGVQTHLRIRVPRANLSSNKSNRAGMNRESNPNGFKSAGPTGIERRGIRFLDSPLD